MIRTLLTLALAVILSGCAALNMKRPVADDDLAKTRHVGVISVLGDTFYGISIGTTVFNNTYFTASVADWGVDKSTTNSALGLLRSNKRFASDLVDKANLSAEQARANDNKLLWEAAEKQGFDRLIVIRPGVSENNAFFRPGYGLFERSLFGNANRCLYAAYVVDVYDVATHKPIAWEWGGQAPCLSNDNNIAFKQKFEDYSVQEQQLMRQRIESLMVESLRYTLWKLALLSPAGVGR